MISCEYIPGGALHRTGFIRHKRSKSHVPRKSVRSRRVLLLLVLVAIVGFLFYRSDHTSRPIDSPPDVVSESRVLPSPPTRLSTKAKLGEDRTLLHPLADPEKRAAYAAQPPPNWEEWAKALTEIRLGRSVEEGYLSKPLRKVASVAFGKL